MASIIIETTDKTVTVNGWTQAKGNFTVQSLGDGYAHIRTHTGQGLRAKLEDITINGETPVSYDDLVTKAQDFFKESGTDSSDAVQSITGDLVDDTDPQNPVINNPTWGQVTGKPTTFTPSAHTHTASQITDFDTEVSNNTAVAANTAKVGVPALGAPGQVLAVNAAGDGLEWVDLPSA